jgi:hypothetical protein
MPYLACSVMPLEGGGCQDVRQRGQRRRDGHTDGRDHASRSSAPQQPGEARGDRHQGGRGEGGRQAQQPDIDTKKLRGSGNEGDERRLVGVPECRMAAADDVIKFVSENIVSAIEG